MSITSCKWPVVTTSVVEVPRFSFVVGFGRFRGKTTVSVQVLVHP